MMLQIVCFLALNMDLTMALFTYKRFFLWYAYKCYLIYFQNESRCFSLLFKKNYKHLTQFFRVFLISNFNQIAKEILKTLTEIH